MDLGLTRKKALVFGSSAGLGRAIAAALVAEGAMVAISSRGGEKLEATQREINANVALAADLARPGAGADLVVRAQQALGGLDILVTNCGGPKKGAFVDIDGPTWETTFRSLWMSAIDGIRAALPNMTANGWGRVLMVTSSTGKETFPSLTLSNAFRPGLHGLANSLSKEVASSGVTVNAIMPGTIDTERLQELGIANPDFIGRIPARRLGRPDEIGSLAAFLASERAAYITGQAIACDGGRMASI
jgi:3-oxoacyl-[acyl-carrier protein] reductase